jgi:undecaprenyl-diphosphatase
MPAAARLLLGFFVAAVVLAAAGWWVAGPWRAAPAAFDATLRGIARGTQSPLWTALFLTVTKFGSTLYLTVIGSIAGIVFIVRRWFRPLGLFIVAMAGQAALHHGFKWLFARPRPSPLIAYPAAESFSFPSGHALSAFCLYAAIAWIFASRLETPALKVGIWIFTIGFIFLIGASRVYIGVHYPTDVAAAFLAAAVWSTAVISADERPT